MHQLRVMVSDISIPQCIATERPNLASQATLGTSPLRIAISSIGRFHMFDLARQMLRLGQDVHLYTGYPMLKVDRDLRPITRTRSRYVILEHLRHRFGSPPKTTWWSDLALEDFGPWLARNIEDVDILDAIAGTGWEAGRRLHAEGKPWICNRGSTHILTQHKLLKEEAHRWGAPEPFLDKGRPLERCLGEYAEADAIVVPSQFCKQSFLDHGVPADKVYVIPLAVDLSLFHRQPKEDNRFRIIFVGSYSLRKGIGYLFEAVRPLVHRGHVEVWLVGGPSPEARHILEKNADLFTDKGFRPRAKLSWFYSQASVLVLPSVEEGLALVIPQAMACGVPVIVTPNTGASEVMTDGQEGFIVPVRDPQAIREKIEWMLSHSQEREAMGEAAMARVTGLGGWDAYGEACLAMYHEVIARKQADLREGPSSSSVGAGMTYD